MPPKTADLDETWAFLNAGVDHIMNHLEQGLSFSGYTALYTTVYNYCTSTKMHGRLDGNRCKCYFCGVLRILAESCALAGANLVGSDLYNKLSEYFILHFRPMLQVRWDESLLNTYSSHNLRHCRKQIRFQMLTCCDTTRRNGIVTRLAQTT
jgi:cullin 1